jgi:hypothetical protein
MKYLFSSDSCKNKFLFPIIHTVIGEFVRFHKCSDGTKSVSVGSKLTHAICSLLFLELQATVLLVHHRLCSFNLKSSIVNLYSTSYVSINI